MYNLLDRTDQRKNKMQMINIKNDKGGAYLVAQW